MTTAYINRIATAVPPHDVHEAFLRSALALFECDRRSAMLLRRMAERSGIEHRYSFLAPAPDGHRGPALDIEVIERCNLPGSIERTIIGFMGCYAAINALKLARHIVRSDADARVLILNLELCTLHFQETTDLAQLLCFLLFSDGCAASLVTSEPHGIALDSFRAMLLPDTRQLMSWNIRNYGFDMVLSGKVPAAIHDALRAKSNEILASGLAHSTGLWAVHAGGRTILDAVERALNLGPTALAVSRDILRRYGNMSSATVMFVLDDLMQSAATGTSGCAMSFGPGLTAETMLFRRAA
jgi:predicted naringenin-chalcone synthase